jgi:hypothetical protein
MIIHCSQKLAAKLPDVSPTSLEETSLLGGWHGHLLTLDRRRCVMFCHDATRYALFLPGLQKVHFAELGSKGFRPLYLATFAAFGCTPAQISKVALALGPVVFDMATDRSVQGSLRVAKQDLEALLYDVPNVRALDPVAVSCKLSHRPATIYGKWVWPDKAMLELVAGL